METSNVNVLVYARGGSRNLRKGGGRSLLFHSCSLPRFLSSLRLLSLRSRALNQPGGLGKRCKLPQWVRLPQWGQAEPRSKTTLVHSKAVRKPLVAIILNILSTVFYSKTIKI